MPYYTLLARIQKLVRDFKCIEEGSKSGWLNLPAQPMTDHELARAIRELADLRLDTAKARQTL